MGRRIGKVLCVILCMMCIDWISVGHGSPAIVHAADNSISLEQAYVNLPQVRIYVNGAENYGTLDASQVEVYREDVKLETEDIKKFSELDEGIAYYVLLDISGSIRDTYFAEIKDALASFRSGLSEKDQMALISFGEEVVVQLEGNESQEEAAAKIAGLQNADDQTLLFEALAQAGDMASRLSGDEYRRKAVLVISDGEDIAKGKSTKEEALSDLKEQGLPVYALAVDYKDTDSFGEFARNTGGSMEVFGAGDILSALQNIQNRMQNSDVLVLSSNSNTVSQKMETLTVKFNQWNMTKMIEAGFYDWQTDEEAPKIHDAEQKEKRKLEISFSESVKGADQAANYQLEDNIDGTVYAPISVEVVDAYSVILTFENEFYEGKYTLQTVNITDTSMEANPIENKKEIILSGQKKPSLLIQFLRNHGYLLAIVAVIILVAAAYLIYRKVKKNKGVVVVDGKMTMADQVDVKRHVAIEQKRRVVLTFTMHTRGRYPAKMEVPISGSLIVGRSDICDVYFDDDQMSRQHFALEYGDGIISVMDLETTNGTMVNGVRIKGKRRLDRGDSICAGTVEMTIDWRENG